ncbi:hypothetical protein CA54_53830 [Symmachiella macrocystis]|uniref:Chaperone protein DnaJ n=1 Tax=Symmachiella macrocystis TaxID=2527985 RepID=A0A5C6B6M2_9PLAN|nr:hypothetical protein [Symmachiella macrocystis]TWU06979.1 hypothetical protein CA54_53830 [Symmachiella macrocystis]
MTTRIHVAKALTPNEHWSAWFDENPTLAFAGESLSEAVDGLLEIAQLDSATLNVDLSQCNKGEVVFIHDGKTCQDCDGTGRYIGLYKVAKCDACGGSGWV